MFGNSLTVHKIVTNLEIVSKVIYWYVILSVQNVITIRKIHDPGPFN